MATKTKETKEKLEFLNKNFAEEDYDNYIKGDLSYTSLCKKYGCTDYLIATFFKSKNLLKRRSVIKDNIKENIFDTINCSESAYIFGLYMADGCITKNNYFLLALNENDIEVITTVKNFISPSTKLTYKKSHINTKTNIMTNPMYLISFKSNHIAHTLNSYGCGHNKTYIEKSITNIVPNKFMWDFIRGYFDGDGCVSTSEVTHRRTLKSKSTIKYKGTNVVFNIVSKTKLILDELCEFLNRQGLHFSVYPADKENSKFLLATHSKKDLCIVYNNLYSKNSKFFMKRKQIKFKKIIDNTEINSEIAKGSESL